VSRFWHYTAGDWQRKVTEGHGLEQLPVHGAPGQVASGQLPVELKLLLIIRFGRLLAQQAGQDLMFWNVNAV
jgi:hypothetical protein